MSEQNTPPPIWPGTDWPRSSAKTWTPRMASTSSVAAMPKDKAGDVEEPLGPELAGAVAVCLAVRCGAVSRR